MENGFRDSSGYALTAQLGDGVFLSDGPLNPTEGTKGTAVIEVLVPDAIAAKREVIEEGKPYREFLIPASQLNTYTRRLLPPDEADELERQYSDELQRRVLEK